MRSAILLLVACLCLLVQAEGENITATFHNKYKDEVKLMWRRDGSSEVEVDVIPSDDSTVVKTYDGHKFVARDKKGSPLEWFHITPSKTAYTITKSPSKLSTAPETADEKLREDNELSRKKLNTLQPQICPRFTDIGYKKMKIPTKVYNAIKKFYNDNKHAAVSENFPPSMSYINHWEMKPTMIYLTSPMEKMVFEGLRSLAEEWADRKLADTQVFGIRMYHTGNWLRNHVDRVDTHVISAILQIDQDVDEDWPLEIYSHDGTAHQVLLEPGDMVFYESAGVLHGRPTPLKGRYYSNVFVHFKPLADWGPFDVWGAPNPPQRPLAPSAPNPHRGLSPASDAVDHSGHTIFGIDVLHTARLLFPLGAAIVLFILFRARMGDKTQEKAKRKKAELHKPKKS